MYSEPLRIIPHPCGPSRVRPAPGLRGPSRWAQVAGRRAQANLRADVAAWPRGCSSKRTEETRSSAAPGSLSKRGAGISNSGWGEPQCVPFGLKPFTTGTCCELSRRRGRSLPSVPAGKALAASRIPFLSASKLLRLRRLFSLFLSAETKFLGPFQPEPALL